tara:strand:+ start:3291 stop:3521 length:231 start_codon:yes stop_codon:yes gene_type:complete
MILELLLAVQLLEPTSFNGSTPQAVAPITKPAKQPTKGSKATLGGGTLGLIGPRAPVTVKPDQVAERYFRRPKGLN